MDELLAIVMGDAAPERDPVAARRLIDAALRGNTPAQEPLRAALVRGLKAEVLRPEHKSEAWWLAKADRILRVAALSGDPE